MSLQVYSSRENPVVYSQGDIGWEIYFIVSGRCKLRVSVRLDIDGPYFHCVISFLHIGVVSVTLPSDSTDLDETGRSNSQANKDKFVSLGSTLSVGNHVGESCINSHSGVRQESIHAVTRRVELFVLSRDDLDDICKLMGDEKGTALKCALLQRNGSSWHSFATLDLEGGSDKSSPTGTMKKSRSSRNSSLLPWQASSQTQTPSGRRSRRYSQTGAIVTPRRRPSFPTPGSV